MRLIAALVIAAAGCGGKKDDAPEPAPAPKPAPAPAPKPVPGAPDCSAVLAGLDVAAICGEPFPLAVNNGPGKRCSLVAAADAPRDLSLRVVISRSDGRRLPDQFPPDGWHVDRDKTSSARLGIYPWLISVRSRGPEVALCAGDEVAALARRVGELIPSDPTATEVPPNSACDAILSIEQLDAACGSKLGGLRVSEREDGADVFCHRSAGRLGVNLTVSTTTSASRNGKPVEGKGGGVAIADLAGRYTVELQTGPALGTGTIPCSAEALKSLFPKVLARARKVLKRRQK
jgi:hypothetical protein